MKKPIEARYLEVMKGIKNVLNESNDIENITFLRSLLSSKKISNDSYLTKALIENFSVISVEEGVLKWTGIDPNVKMAKKLVECVKNERAKTFFLRKKKEIIEKDTNDLDVNSNEEEPEPQYFEDRFHVSRTEIHIDMKSKTINIKIS